SVWHVLRCCPSSAYQALEAAGKDPGGRPAVFFCGWRLMDLSTDELAKAREQMRAAWRAQHPGASEAEMPAALRDPAARQHNGLLVALWLPASTAAQLALPGGEPPDALHVTLCYCGDVAEMDELTIYRAINAVDRTVNYRPPLEGRIGGYGRFSASESSDGREVFYAAVDVPDLAEMRADIAR